MYLNISPLIASWEPSEKKCFALFMLVGSMKCNRGQLYPRRCGRGL